MDETQNGKKMLRLAVEVTLCLLIAVILVGLIQQFFLAPVAVVGESMMPTINESGDKVYVQKKFYNISRGDVVVFYRPNNKDVTSKNPSNSISVADFFNSLPFVNKIPKVSEDAASDYTCVIKRVIGVEGDHIEIRYVSASSAQLLRNGSIIKDFPMYPTIYVASGGVKEGSWTVGKGELFVLGDNRNNSFDSEDYGPIQASWLMGKVVLAKIDGKYKRKL